MAVLTLASSAIRLRLPIASPFPPPPTTRLNSPLNSLLGTPPFSHTSFGIARGSSRRSAWCAGALGTDRTVYQGVYGPWTVEDEDVREVSSKVATFA